MLCRMTRFWRAFVADKRTVRPAIVAAVFLWLAVGSHAAPAWFAAAVKLALFAVAIYFGAKSLSAARAWSQMASEPSPDGRPPLTR